MSKRAEYFRQRYLTAKANGICTACIVAPASPGRSVCDVCRRKRKVRLQGCRQRQWQRKRQRKGLCSVCGTSKLHTKTMCEPCAEKVKQRSRAYRAWVPPVRGNKE